VNTPRYIPVTTLPDALRNWTGKPFFSHPGDKAPCGYLPGASEENAILARVFSQLTALPTTTDRLGFLLSTIAVHERRVAMTWDAARGRSNARSFDAIDRSAMVRLRPYEAMIDALKLWLDELHEAAMAEIGQRFAFENAHQPRRQAS
jgi:hypothetical protein